MNTKTFLLNNMIIIDKKILTFPLSSNTGSFYYFSQICIILIKKFIFSGMLHFVLISQFFLSIFIKKFSYEVNVPVKKKIYVFYLS